MRVRYHIDADTGLPHVYNHGVRTEEVEDVLRLPMETRLGRGGSHVALGQTRAGRYLRVVFAVDDSDGSLFVITAFQLTGKPLGALKRRRRRP